MKEKISSLIKQNLKYDSLTVDGSDSKYTVNIVSEAFNGKSTIDRHKIIYAIVDQYIKTGEIHALTIKASTLGESKQ